ncbi:PREDICTED: protein BCCIP homolog isoform X2 [Populus euphratica]|uniref:Protein BCCIP homolog n=1 Tax=Populus euphratica TaxID=75702 RepID=A0AAJ6V1S6_POPEU|nr:PREDICTED: protein BCCIP homolog isoform X2 [Populus euphratica]
MPRKPTRRRRSLIARPLTFAPFSRSLAHLHSTFMPKHQMLGSKVPGSPSHNEVVKKTSKEKIEQSESSEEEEFGGEVQADFAFFDPKPDDFHGVKILLQSYLDNTEWDLSGFVDLILEQTTVGTVVKIEDDEDNGLFSVVSALNLGRYKDHKCIADLKEYLLRLCLEKSIKGDLRVLLGEQAHNVGLLVSRRVVNLPPQLLPPLYDALFDEISWATEDEPTEELRNSFCFNSYVLVSKMYKHKNADKKNQLSSDSEEAIIYVNPEDEIFHKLSLWSFNFPFHAEQVTARELKNYRPMGLVMAVEADKISTFREQLHSLIDEP